MIVDLWTDLFVPGVPWIEKLVRPAIVYGFLVVSLRLSGKRLLAQFTTYDLVVLLILSNTVQNAIIGNDNSVAGGLVGAVALLLLNAVVVQLTYRHHSIESVLEGSEEVLIEHGAVCPEVLIRRSITEAELQAAIQRQGYARFLDVERAVLTPSGQLTCVGRLVDEEDRRHQEVLDRLDALGRSLDDLRSRLPA
jgi:uncharacterized membrane protein YcaP (DUF421 family)